MPSHEFNLFGEENRRRLNAIGVLDTDRWCDMDAATYFNQRPDYGDSERGEWFVQSDRLAFDMRLGHHNTIYLVLFTGTFGNDHSPGASSFTYCSLYDVSDPAEVAEYLAEVKRMNNLPEYLDHAADCECESCEEDRTEEEEEEEEEPATTTEGK